MPGRNHGFEPAQRTARELHRRPSGRQVDHPHVAPHHTPPRIPVPSALAARLLGGKARGRRCSTRFFFRSARARSTSSEDAGEKAVAMPFDHAGNASHVADVGADAKNHVWIIPGLSGATSKPGNSRFHDGFQRSWVDLASVAGAIGLNEARRTEL